MRSLNEETREYVKSGLDGGIIRDIWRKNGYDRFVTQRFAMVSHGIIEKHLRTNSDNVHRLGMNYGYPVGMVPETDDHLEEHSAACLVTRTYIT